jgi:hypothetical protein
MPQQVCSNKEFFVMQAKIMERAIEEDKWYLSEAQHHDVGWEVAKEHFFKTYSSGFAAGFKACYCALTCPARRGCALAQQWKVELSS